MNKLTFFRGALIASVLSVVFWVGAATFVINFNDSENTQEEIQKEEVEENTYAML